MREHTADRADLAELRADCESCFGLCCVALPFARSADFALDKDAGRPCPNLRTDHRCGIHTTLRERGFPGCTVYDCFGAGQRVSQVTFGGRDWRTGPQERSRRMFDVFPVVRQLHELLWYLTEALALPAARPVDAELRRALADTGHLAEGTPEELAPSTWPRTGSGSTHSCCASASWPGPAPAGGRRTAATPTCWEPVSGAPTSPVPTCAGPV